MKPDTPTFRGHADGRRRAGRAQSPERMDPYQPVGKLHEPSACPQCGAVYHNGRWQWMSTPEGATAHLCQACRRINDQYPAGIVALSGTTVADQGGRLIRLARHQEDIEKAEHPLNRIMAVEVRAPDAIEITTTDIHLPVRIGQAIERTYHGKMTEHFDEDAYFVRVTWHG